MCKRLILTVLFVCSCSLTNAQDYGLDSAEAIGPYLDNVLPQQQPGPTGSWQAVSAFPNLTISFGGGYPFEPVFITQAPRSENMFVCDKKGKIWFFDRDPAVSSATLFLDISARTFITRNAGLGTIAFHPDFGFPDSPNRGYVYLHYFWSPEQARTGPANQVGDGGDELPNPGYWRLSRFTVQDGQSVADPSSELILMQQYDAHHWHNGGSLFFDNDGFLYLTSGDIGGDENFYGAGQSLTEGLFGGLLRIDVDKDATRSHPIRRQPDNFDRRNTKPAAWPDSYTQEYFIPDDNPWLDANGGQLEEFWCLGLRSPHRASYDAATGDIWVGDVGQQTKEEISLLKKAYNYQWPHYEGTTFRGGTPSTGTSQAPAHDYANPGWQTTGAAVIGGYVYRGFEHRAELEGRYIFADHQIGTIWVGDKQPDGSLTVSNLITDFPSGFHFGISSFGLDSNGELYICRLSNSGGMKEIVKLVRTTSTSIPEPPALLSNTGVFTSMATREPAAGIHPYAPNAPFWSDGAVKRRFIAVPNDGSHDTAAEKISFSATENWEFPTGTVLVKHFDYPVDDADPSMTKPVETRFMVHGSDGRYHGFTYKWNEAGTEADLLMTSDTATINVATIGGGTRSVDWYFPSRTDCRNCHTDAAGNLLSVRTHQLNGFYGYAESGVRDNQLRAMNHIGLFDTALSDAAIAGYPASSNITDPELPLEDRVRSYLDSNCSGCHRPGGVYAAFDARFTTPLASQGLINSTTFRNYGIAGQGLIRPREVEKSIAHLRANVAAGASLQMPPLAKNHVDEEAMRVIAQWISTLDPAAWPDSQYSAPDGPPVALDDVVSFYDGAEIDINVLANDYDPDGAFQPVSVAVLEMPDFGNASLKGTTVQYTHSGGGPGSDSLTYTVTDQAGFTSNVGRVHLRLVSAAEYWRDLHALTGPEAEWDYDADGDGLNNGIEFALGSSPVDPTDRSKIIQTLNADSVDLSINKSGYPGIAYEFETSTTLGGWVPATVTVLSDTGEVLTVRAPLEEKRFFRLKATIAE